MEISKEKANLTVTRPVQVQSIQPAMHYDRQQKARALRSGYSEIKVGSMIGIFKFQIEDVRVSSLKVSEGGNYELTYTFREVPNQYGDLLCYFNDVIDMKPIS